MFYLLFIALWHCDAFFLCVLNNSNSPSIAVPSLIPN